MFFGIILTRILFVACMVFIIGYVFGSFSKKRSLTTITRIATILIIVLFIAANAFMMCSGGARHGNWRHEHYNGHYQPADTVK